VLDASWNFIGRWEVPCLRLQNGSAGAGRLSSSAWGALSHTCCFSDKCDVSGKTAGVAAMLRQEGAALTWAGGDQGLRELLTIMPPSTLWNMILGGV